MVYASVQQLMGFRVVSTFWFCEHSCASLSRDACMGVELRSQGGPAGHRVALHSVFGGAAGMFSKVTAPFCFHTRDFVLKIYKLWFSPAVEGEFWEARHQLGGWGMTPRRRGAVPHGRRGAVPHGRRGAVPREERAVPHWRRGAVTHRRRVAVPHGRRGAVPHRLDGGVWVGVYCGDKPKLPGDWMYSGRKRCREGFPQEEWSRKLCHLVRDVEDWDSAKCSL